MKDRTKSVQHDIHKLFGELNIWWKFDLTVILHIFLTRSSGTLIVLSGQYSPMVFMRVCLDSDVFQYTTSYPNLGSPLLSKNICVVFTVKLTFLISLRSCGDKHKQNYIDVQSRNDVIIASTTKATTKWQFIKREYQSHNCPETIRLQPAAS